MRTESDFFSKSKDSEYRLLLTPDSIVLECSSLDSNPSFRICDVPVSSCDLSDPQESSLHDSIVTEDTRYSDASQVRTRTSMDDLSLSRNTSTSYSNICSTSKDASMCNMSDVYDSCRLHLPILSSSYANGQIASLSEKQHNTRGAQAWNKFLEAANATGRLSIQLSDGCVELVATSSEIETADFSIKSPAAVPFKWEEAPGKPKPCYVLDFQAHDLSLKPPPRLSAPESRKKSSNSLKHRGLRGFLSGKRTRLQDMEKVSHNPLFVDTSRNTKSEQRDTLRLALASTISDQSRMCNAEAPTVLADSCSPTVEARGVDSDQSQTNAVALKDLPTLRRSKSVSVGSGGTTSWKNWFRGKHHKEKKVHLYSSVQGVSSHAKPSAAPLIHQPITMHRHVADVPTIGNATGKKRNNSLQRIDSFIMGDKNFAYPFTRSSSCSSSFVQREIKVVKKPVTPHVHLRSSVYQVIRYFTLSPGKPSHKKVQLHGKNL